ncbi:MAG: nucleotidyltransferase [Mycobacteriaceae bacterium]|nr:nucleotidyltransferase [Mycobacteriaceae bacterium]
MAEQNTVLRGQVGSGLHGVITGSDDRDEMGVCIEPPECVIGNSKFAQYRFRTQAEGVRSPGDLDLVIYSLRKWARLAAQGNPRILLLMFIPVSELVFMNDLGWDIQAHPERFLSKKAASRFSGYLVAQQEKMLGLRGQGTTRSELVEVHGFDTKSAYHMIRVGLQGVELLTTGRISLPTPEPDLTWLRELSDGKHSMDEALDRGRNLLDQIDRLGETADLPDSPDWRHIDDWLTRTYREWWDRTGQWP